MSLSLSVMNPPKKTKRHSTAKQIAWRKKFAQLYGNKNGTKRKHTHKSTRTTSTKGTTVANKKKKGKSSGKRYSSAPRGGGGRGVFRMADGLLGDLKSVAPTALAATAGFVGVVKIADALPASLTKNADGSANPNKRLAMKGAATVALFMGARMAGMRDIAHGLLIGGAVNCLYDLAARYAPAGILPATLTGSDDYSGSIPPQQFAALSGGMGFNVAANSNRLAGSMPGF